MLKETELKIVMEPFSKLYFLSEDKSLETLSVITVLVAEGSLLQNADIFDNTNATSKEW